MDALRDFPANQRLEVLQIQTWDRNRQMYKVKVMTRWCFQAGWSHSILTKVGTWNKPGFAKPWVHVLWPMLIIFSSGVWTRRLIMAKVTDGLRYLCIRPLAWQGQRVRAWVCRRVKLKSNKNRRRCQMYCTIQQLGNESHIYHSFIWISPPVSIPAGLIHNTWASRM